MENKYHRCEICGEKKPLKEFKNTSVSRFIDFYTCKKCSIGRLLRSKK